MDSTTPVIDGLKVGLRGAQQGHLGAFTLLCDSRSHELGDQRCQQGVVEALSPLLNGDPQALVDQLKLHPAGFTDLLPSLQDHSLNEMGQVV